MPHSILKKSILIVGAFLFAALILLFSFRNQLMQKLVERFQHKLFQEYHLQLKIGDIRFEGLNKLKAERLSLKDVANDEIFSVKSVDAVFSMPHLFIGKLRIQSLQTNHFCLNVFDSNARFFYHRIKPLNPIHHSATTSSDKFAPQRWMQVLNVFANTDVTLKNNIFCFCDSFATDTVLIPQFTLFNNHFSTFVRGKSETDSLSVNGKFDVKNKGFSCAVSNSGQKISAMSVLQRRFNLSANFDSLLAILNWKILDNHEIGFDLKARVYNGVVAHFRLAPQPVTFPFLQVDLAGYAGTNSLHFDSTSLIQLRDLPVHFFADFQKQDSNYKIFLEVKIPEVEANVFFQSLPTGMFHTLEGIECNGSLAYQLKFAVDSRHLDSLIFDSDLKRKDFFIKKFGAKNFLLINEDFLHEVVVNDRLIKRIFVGRENPDFTPLSKVSPLLISSVLQSEDPSFFEHRGFVESAFRESIVQNIRERRFARGGSTISMQLVKNVFLSRSKNVARKIEEALIVYLIENLHLVSKDRMLEVYLNIIEWGPNVYGIGEAASFYFHKKPSELNLAESVFLAGIIPNPKYFKYQIECDGTFKTHFLRYAEILINRMMLRGKISENEVEKFEPKILLKGEALKTVAPTSFIMGHTD